MTTFAKAILVWLAILAVAMLNGVMREGILNPFFGKSIALPASGLILCGCILAAAVLATPWFGDLGSAGRWRIGMLWLVLTVGFELIVGYAQHQSWSQLADAYTLEGGNLWPLVLFTALIAPWLGARIRGGSS